MDTEVFQIHNLWSECAGENDFPYKVPDADELTFMDAGYEVAKIFTPEHGLYGAEAGEKVDDSKHPRYQIPVLSLYGDRRMPGKKDLEGLDLLVYDIQDVGLRYYTYIYTMCYALGAAADAGIPYVILDRQHRRSSPDGSVRQ